MSNEHDKLIIKARRDIERLRRKEVETSISIAHLRDECKAASNVGLIPLLEKMIRTVDRQTKARQQAEKALEQLIELQGDQLQGLKDESPKKRGSR